MDNLNQIRESLAFRKAEIAYFNVKGVDGNQRYVTAADRLEAGYNRIFEVD